MESLVKKEGIVSSSGKIDDDMSLTSIGKKRNKNLKWDMLVLLVDLSGSMAGGLESGISKLDAEIDALTNMIEKGQDGQDTLIVEFPSDDDGDKEVTVSMVMNKPSIIMSYIRAFSPRGCTPMYSALQEAYDRTIERSPRFMLLSDGHPNDMGHNAGDILRLVEKNKDVATIDVVGIGDPGSGNYDPVFLKKIAELTGGIYTEVMDYEQFVKELLELAPANRGQITDGKSGGVIAL